MSYYREKPDPSTVEVGDKFVVTYNTKMNGHKLIFGGNENTVYGEIKLGDILELRHNDGSICPAFWMPDKSDYHYFDWGIFHPLDVSEAQSRELQIGDIIQFIDNHGKLCEDNIKAISTHNTHNSGDPLYEHQNEWGTYDLPINEGTIVAIEGKYAMVAWKCDETRNPCIRFNIKNLKLINNDVRTTIKPESEGSGTTTAGVFCGGSPYSITVGHPGYKTSSYKSTATIDSCKISSSVQFEHCT